MKGFIKAARWSELSKGEQTMNVVYLVTTLGYSVYYAVATYRRRLQEILTDEIVETQDQTIVTMQRTIAAQERTIAALQGDDVR